MLLIKLNLDQLIATWCLYAILLGREVLLLYHGFLGIGSLLKTPCRATLGIQSSTSGGKVVLVTRESLFIPNLETRGMVGWVE